MIKWGLAEDQLVVNFFGFQLVGVNDGLMGCFSAQGKRIDQSFQVWPHSSGRNTAILTGSSSSTLGGGGVGGVGGGVARELSVSSERQGGGGRNPRPYSGSRYKYLGELAENLKNVRVDKGIICTHKWFPVLTEKGCFYVKFGFFSSHW